ncbi:12489_t:CDS:2, partial [Acaulospora colombiana]
SSRLFNSEDSIYATLESELHCARDENRRLVELSNVLGDMSKTIENKSNKLYSDSNLPLLQKIEETQAKFNAHLEKCEIEKKEKILDDNLKETQSKNFQESSDTEYQIRELSSQLACTREQLTEEQAIHSDQVEKMRLQITEVVSQLEMTRSELENIKLRHESKIEVLNQQISDVVNQLNHAHEELERIHSLHETDAEDFKQLKMKTPQGNLDGLQSLPVNPLNSSHINLDNPREVHQTNVFVELFDLKTKYEKMATDHESLVSRLNAEHASLVANKENQITILREEKLDFLNQFSQFRKETLSALDTVKKQLSAAQETISSIANENESLNCRLEKALIENEGLKKENAEIKTEFELWRKEKQSGPLNQHKKQESTVKDSEWTDNEWDVGDVLNGVTIDSIEKSNKKEYKKILVKSH